jgi:hypothetical protein
VAIISVDLAYLDYRDFGLAVLNDGPSGATYELLPFADDGVGPEPDHTADLVIAMSRRFNASLIVLDGPQGWKDPSNGLQHSRICERALNAPAKTGLPGNAKPANYLRFIEFTVQVFDALDARGWHRFDPAAWHVAIPWLLNLSHSLPGGPWDCNVFLQRARRACVTFSTAYRAS